MPRWYLCPKVGETLRVPLECYLCLSLTRRMKGNLLRLADIKEYIGQLDGGALGLEGVFQ